MDVLEHAIPNSGDILEKNWKRLDLLCDYSAGGTKRIQTLWNCRFKFEVVQPRFHQINISTWATWYIKQTFENIPYHALVKKFEKNWSIFWIFGFKNESDSRFLPSHGAPRVSTWSKSNLPNTRHEQTKFSNTFRWGFFEITIQIWLRWILKKKKKKKLEWNGRFNQCKVSSRLLIDSWSIHNRVASTHDREEIDVVSKKDEKKERQEEENASLPICPHLGRKKHGNLCKFMQIYVFLPCLAGERLR